MCLGKGIFFRSARKDRGEGRGGDGLMRGIVEVQLEWI